MPIDPLVLTFALGVAARLVRSDLRFPEPVYEALSIYLLLAIGLKGGVELSHQPLSHVALPAVFAVFAGFALPFILFPVLRHVVGLARSDAASVAAHYGSVSVVTFAIATAYLQQRVGIPAPRIAQVFNGVDTRRFGHADGQQLHGQAGPHSLHGNRCPHRPDVEERASCLRRRRVSQNGLQRLRPYRHGRHEPYPLA